MTIVEKAAYLKGLTAGLGIEPDSRDGRLWAALTDLLSDMAHEIEDLQASHLDLAEALDDVYEDLGRLEELSDDAALSEAYDDFEDFEDEADNVYDLADYGLGADDGDEDEEEELSYEGVMYDVTCPSCGEEITFDEETLELGSITCPACGEVLEFDLGESGDGDDGGDEDGD